MSSSTGAGNKGMTTETPSIASRLPEIHHASTVNSQHPDPSTHHWDPLLLESRIFPSH
jgi:hypothetical protein